MEWRVRGADPVLRDEVRKTRAFIEETRGRKMPCDAVIGTFGGKGPYLYLADGSIKFDFVRGMGTHLWGYQAPHLMSARGSCYYSAMTLESHFSPSPYYVDFLRAIQKEAPPHLVHIFPCSGGAVANDFALKMAFAKKKCGAKNLFAFEGAFHGRTIGASYITDISSDRPGFPQWVNVFYLPFYDPKRPEESIKNAETAFKRELKTCLSGSVSCFLLELFQGEGGFRMAPREFFVPLFEIAKNENIPLIFDEVHTGLRTGNFLYSQRLGLESFADIVTLGKALQASAVLFTKEFDAERGIAQTMPMTTPQAVLGACTVRHLREYKYWSHSATEEDEGIIRANEKIVACYLALLKEELEPRVKEAGALGNLFFLELCDDSLKAVKNFCARLFEKGMIAYWCGHEPYRARFYFPIDITDEELKSAFHVIKDVIREIV